jgi:hypothetical protein
MPKAYHHIFFTVRDGIADDEVIQRYCRFRDIAVSKGYIKSVDDFSVGKVVIPAGDATSFDGGGNPLAPQAKLGRSVHRWAELPHEPQWQAIERNVHKIRHGASLGVEYARG